MAYSEILLEVADGVALVTLNRPERMNAYTSAMGRELHEAFAACDADDAVRAIIVTGRGPRLLRGRRPGAWQRRASTGARPPPSSRRARRRRPTARGRSRARAIAPWNVRKPIIAAINGAAVGVGATLPMQWDIRLAGRERAHRLRLRPPRRRPRGAQHVDAAATRRHGARRRAAHDRAHPRRARGARVRPREPRRPRRGAPARGARARRRDRARRGAGLGRDHQVDALGHADGDATSAHADDVDARAFWWTGTQPDAREGVRAFLEKRPPRWSMRPSTDMPDFLVDPRLLGSRRRREKRWCSRDRLPRPAEPARQNGHVPAGLCVAGCGGRAVDAAEALRGHREPEPARALDVDEAAARPVTVKMPCCTSEMTRSPTSIGASSAIGGGACRARAPFARRGCVVGRRRPECAP